MDTSAESLDRWRQMRFGMFIHWGPVSLKGTEIGWSRGAQVPQEEYDQLYKQFNPTRFNADEWVSLAKTAGMKYLVITSKHHDGFCLWDSRYTDYNIMATPFGRDVLAELSEACRRQGVMFCVYYSIPDWWHPDYPKGSPGGRTEKPNPNMPRYFEYVKNQTRELIDKYGKDGFVVLGIAVDSREFAKVPGFVEQMGMNYPVLYDETGVSNLYGGIRSIPTTFVVNKDGRVVYRIVGSRPKEVFEEVVTSLL